MADATPLKRQNGITSEFGATDTVKVSNLPVMVGDSGAGGTAGVVPAPITGDATKFLRGDATWADAGGGGASVIVPSTISTDQTDYSPTGWSGATAVLLNFGTGFPAINSFAAGSDGEIKTLTNTGTNSGYIPAEHPAGTAANRVFGGQDYILDSNDTVTIMYSTSISRWIVIATSFNPALLPIKGKGLFYQESAGATNASSFPSLNFSTTGGANGTIAASTSIPAAWGLQGSAVNQAAGLNWTRGAPEISAFGSAHMAAYILFSMSTLSTSAQRFQVDFSITASPATNTAAINNSVGIRYKDDVNSGKFLLFSRDNGGTESTADSGVTVAASTLYQMSIFYNKARTEARFYINETFVGRITGNQPNAVVCSPRINLIKTVGSTGRDIYVHSFGSYVVY